MIERTRPYKLTIVSGKYFAHSLGWPIAVFVAGFAMIGVSFLARSVRHLSATQATDTPYFGLGEDPRQEQDEKKRQGSGCLKIFIIFIIIWLVVPMLIWLIISARLRNSYSSNPVITPYTPSVTASPVPTPTASASLSDTSTWHTWKSNGMSIKYPKGTGDPINIPNPKKTDPLEFGFLTEPSVSLEFLKGTSAKKAVDYLQTDKAQDYGSSVTSGETTVNGYKALTLTRIILPSSKDIYLASSTDTNYYIDSPGGMYEIKVHAINDSNLNDYMPTAQAIINTFTIITP